VSQQELSQVSRRTNLGIGAVVLIVLASVYFLFDPGSSSLFPKCPFLLLTGLECPGCGSQRAVHELLNMNFLAAIRSNALVVVSIPYIITGIILEISDIQTPQIDRLRNTLYGVRAIYIVLTVIIAFWIIRNLI
jgi:hypothetical protein